MRNRWASFLFGIVAAAPLSFGQIAVAVSPTQERADSRPQGSRLEQSAGSPSSFGPLVRGESVASVEGAAGQEPVRRHVVVVVWDGMRPDFVSEQNTPTLYELARQGATFANHHSVYLSATEVNGTAISTGAYPANDGIVGNIEYRPALDLLKPIHTEWL